MIVIKETAGGRLTGRQTKVSKDLEKNLRESGVPKEVREIRITKEAAKAAGIEFPEAGL